MVTALNGIEKVMHLLLSVFNMDRIIKSSMKKNMVTQELLFMKLNLQDSRQLTATFTIRRAFMD